MKKTLAISFAILILGITLRDFVIYSHFKLDQSFIAKILCINKDKPTLKCDGKCYLKQKLNESHSEDDTKNPFSKEERRTINLFVLQNQLIYSITQKNQSSFVFKEHGIFTAHLRDLLRPPQSIL